MKVCLLLLALTGLLTTGAVPERLLELYHDLPSRTKEGIITANMSALRQEDIDKLPTSLVYLLPVSLLKTMSGSSLAQLLQNNQQDVGVAVKIIEALEQPRDRLNFLDMLVGVDLPVETQQHLGNALYYWWPDIKLAGDEMEDHIILAIRNGSPLLSYLPTNIVRNFHGKIAEKFAFWLRARNRSSLRSWSYNSKLVHRVWAELIFREIYSHWTPAETKGFEFVIIGATPSEIQKLSKHHLELRREDIFNTYNSYDKMQSRTLFSVLYAAAPLTTANLTQMLPIAMQLAPRDLQRFSVNETDFKISGIAPYLKKSSFATDKQVGELLITQAIFKKKISNVDDVSVEHRIKELGTFAYTLPSHVFDFHPNMTDKEWSTVLTLIDSSKLSRKQAWLATKEGTLLDLTTNSIMGLHGLLKAITIKKMGQYHWGELPHNILHHLATSLPKFEPAISLDVLFKLKPQLDDINTLESLMVNEQSSQFFTLLSSRQIQMQTNVMFNNLQTLSRKMPEKAKQLPRYFLQVLLHSTPPTSNKWKRSYLVQHIAFMGLSCNVIDKLHLNEAIDILSQYNIRLQAEGKRFPKSLQFCCQQLIYSYLNEKAYILQVDSNGTILNLLEPAEIQAIGGYILAGIHPELIEQAQYSAEILHVIGQLHLHQLWEASGRRSRIDRFTNMALKHLVKENEACSLELDELLQLGSFVHFLTAQHIKCIKPADFKFYLETLESNHSKTLCTGEKERLAWFELIKGAFGQPKSWTETTLWTLGDWLVAVPDTVLDLVHSKHWTVQIDDLIEKTAYHKELLWPGKVQPIMFYEVCMGALSQDEGRMYDAALRRLMNRYLIVSQSQLDTILSSQQLLQGIQGARFVLTLPGIKVQKLATEIEMIQLNKDSLKGNITHVDELQSTPKSSVVYKKDIPAANIKTKVLIPSVSAASEVTERPKVNGETATRTTESESSIVHEQTQMLNDMQEPTSDNEEFHEMSDHVSKHKRGLSKRSTILEGIETVKLSEESSNLRIIKKSKSNMKPTSIKIENDNRTRKKISCDAIRSMGFSASLALQQGDIDFMATDEVVLCLDVFGTLKLSHEMYMHLWHRIKSSNKTLLLSNIMHLGHVVQAIEKEDIDELNLNLTLPHTLDVVALLGREVRYGRLLEILGAKLAPSNTVFTEVGPSSLVALGRILCELPMSTGIIRQLMGSWFLDVVTSLGQSLAVHNALECPENCLDQLANLAMENNAFGPPDKWSADDLASLGAISAGLLPRKWQLVPASAMHGLTPSSVKCISPQALKELSVDQLVHFSPLAAAMVSEAQLSSLSQEQKSAISQVRDLRPIVMSLHQDKTPPATTSGVAIVSMNVYCKDRQLFIKYLRSEMLVIIYMFLYIVVVISVF